VRRVRQRPVAARRAARRASRDGARHDSRDRWRPPPGAGAHRRGADALSYPRPAAPASPGRWGQGRGRSPGQRRDTPGADQAAPRPHRDGTTSAGC